MKKYQQKYKPSEPEQMILKLNLLVLGFFILTAWITTRMTLAIYTLVHLLIFLANLWVLTKGTWQKIISQILVCLGLAGSLSAIWLIASYASFFN